MSTQRDRMKDDRPHDLCNKSDAFPSINCKLMFFKTRSLLWLGCHRWWLLPATHNKPRLKMSEVVVVRCNTWIATNNQSPNGFPGKSIRSLWRAGWLPGRKCVSMSRNSFMKFIDNHKINRSRTTTNSGNRREGGRTVELSTQHTQYNTGKGEREL